LINEFALIFQHLGRGCPSCVLSSTSAPHRSIGS
jgi:hypothetical protein